MYGKRELKVNIKHKTTFILFCVFSFFLIFNIFNETLNIFNAKAFPSIKREPQDLVLRAEFSTSILSSSKERKSNIKLCAKKLNDCFIDIGAQFSFNDTVGERTEKNGYLPAKIIKDGAFIDGVGGGVCQVSTTLYNAALLAGLRVLEYHPHSLSINYVSPSLDAMVNYYFADLRFCNDTDNPIYIKTKVANDVLTIKIFGEPLNVLYKTESVLKEIVPAPPYEIVSDEKHEFPNLYKGQREIVQRKKDGIKSESYLLKYSFSGELLGKEKIRNDYYRAVKGIMVEGVLEREDFDSEII